MTNTKKWFAAIALLFVGYLIHGNAPDTIGANYTTPAPSNISSELDRVTQTPAHEPWGMNYTVEHNTTGGEGGWVMTEVGIPYDHECVIQVSLRPYRAIVVSDSSVMCEQAAVEGDADTPSSRSQLPGDRDDDLRGNAPHPAEIHGDTRAAHGDTRQRQGDARDRAVTEDGTSVPEGYYDEAPAPAPAKPSKPAAESTAAPTTPAAPAPSSNLVNLNTASQSELEALPGVGEKTAQKIIAARPLASVGAVDSLPGVGPAMFGQIKDLVTV